jgi:hypothetical protein
MEECWYRHIAKHATLPGGLPTKDTPGFLAVQAQKSWWLGMSDDHGRNLGWIDFAIFHLPGIDEPLVRHYAESVDRACPYRITAATIWGPPAPRQEIDMTTPAWHFAGGAIIVPSFLAMWFHVEVTRAADYVYRTTGMSTWEVNLWSIVASRNPDMFMWWQCDHDTTLLSNAP